MCLNTEHCCSSCRTIRFRGIFLAIVFNLDKLLASRKMQSVELAEKLECTVQTVSRIKNGKIRALRIDSLDRICEVLIANLVIYLSILAMKRLKKDTVRPFWRSIKSIIVNRCYCT